MKRASEAVVAIPLGQVIEAICRVGRRAGLLERSQVIVDLWTLKGGRRRPVLIVKTRRSSR